MLSMENSNINCFESVRRNIFFSGNRLLFNKLNKFIILSSLFNTQGSSLFFSWLWIYTVIHWMMRICSRKCIIRWFHCCANIECTHTKLDCIARYTSRLCGTPLSYMQSVDHIIKRHMTVLRRYGYIQYSKTWIVQGIIHKLPFYRS